MNVTLKTAVVGAIVTIFAALLTALVSYFREWSEREKWKRTLELDEQRIKNDEIKWALELNNQRELYLHKARLRTYPEVFEALAALSSYNLHEFDEDKAKELADKLTKWGYGEAGLCMLPDTRDSLFSLRDTLGRFGRKEISKDLMIGELSRPDSIRVDVIERMRRDLNHSWSQWRDLKPILDVNREIVGHLMESHKRKQGNEKLEEGI